MLASSTENGEVYIHDLNTQKEKELINVYDPQPSPITDIHWFTANSLLLCDNFLVNLYDLEKKKMVRTFEGHNETILVINYNIFHNLVISGGYGNTILVWDVRTSKPVNCIMAHAREITSLCFSNDSMNILSTAQDGFSRIWSLYTGNCKTTLCVDNTSISTSSKFSRNGKYVLVSTLSDLITLWDWNKSELIKRYDGHQNKVEYIESYFLQQQGKYKGIMTFSEDNKFYIWNLYNEQIIYSKTIHSENQAAYKLYANELDENTNNIFFYNNHNNTILNYKINF